MNRTCLSVGLALAAFAALASPSDAQTILGYTGSSQTYVVPAGITSIRIKAWGGGGGAASNISSTYGTGGGSGYAQADVAVTPGQSITVIVGQGGAGYTSTEGYAGAAYPNGGSAANFGGGGGGRTEVSGAGFDLVAAGGGGGGYYFNGNSGQGGFGGAASGGAGGSSPNNAGGQGGTQAAGGAGGHGDSSTGATGALRAGGAANGGNSPAGSGGDGFYGGGGGGGGLTGVGDSGGGGGGGSSTVSGGSAANIVTTAGAGSVPGNSTDSTRETSGCSALGNYGAGAGATAATYRGGGGEVSITALVTTPVFSSSLSQSVNQGQTISYQITAYGNPTSYGATGLPAGLSINTSTGQITGRVTATGTLASTLTATNSYGSTNATLTWTITAAQIVDAASVSPSIIVINQSLTLTRNGTANFGIAYTENTIWPPTGSAIVLGNMQLGSMNYTPVSGAGTYSWQFRVVDNNSNYVDQWITFTVDSASVTAPTTVQTTTDGSTFITISWSGATAQLGIASYNVYRNGTYLGNTASSSFTDVTAIPSSAYAYTVVTVDTQGNISSASSALNVTAAADFEVFTPIP